MNYNIAPFRNAHEKNVQDLYQSDGVDAIALYCAVSFCPVIAAYTFCQEIAPDDVEVARRVLATKNFYGLDKVFG